MLIILKKKQQQISKQSNLGGKLKKSKIQFWLIRFSLSFVFINIYISYTKKGLINIKLFKLSIPLILFIELDMWLGFLWWVLLTYALGAYISKSL